MNSYVILITTKYITNFNFNEFDFKKS